MWNPFKAKKPIHEFTLTSKDKVFFLESLKRSKEFLRLLLGFVNEEKGNIGYLKIKSRNITHVIMDIETFDLFKNAADESEKLKDDIYVMSKIIEEVNKN